MKYVIAAAKILNASRKLNYFLNKMFICDALCELK